MPFTIEWGNEEKTISHLKVIGSWDWNDYYAATKQGYEMIESVDHTVNIIIDFTDSNGSLPPSAMTHLRKSANNAHPRRGVLVMVSKRMILLKTFVNLLQKVTRAMTTVYLAGTLDEAYTIINEIRDEKSDTIR